MLPEDILERSYALKTFFGCKKRACHGTDVSQQLQQGRRLCRWFASTTTSSSLPNEGGTSTERHFKASSRYPAFLCAKLTLGISGRLTPERFLDAGGIKLLLGISRFIRHAVTSFRRGRMTTAPPILLIFLDVARYIIHRSMGWW